MKVLSPYYFARPCGVPAAVPDAESVAKGKHALRHMQMELSSAAPVVGSKQKATRRFMPAESAESTSSKGTGGVVVMGIVAHERAAGPTVTITTTTPPPRPPPPTTTTTTPSISTTTTTMVSGTTTKSTHQH